jgi:hypothetical protein
LRLNWFRQGNNGGSAQTENALAGRLAGAVAHFAFDKSEDAFSLTCRVAKHSVVFGVPTERGQNHRVDGFHFSTLV